MLSQPDSQPIAPSTSGFNHCIGVAASTAAFEQRAIELAQRFELPLLSSVQLEASTTAYNVKNTGLTKCVRSAALVLWVSVDGIGLRQLGVPQAKPVYVDFCNGALAYRGLHAPHSKELIAKAVGVKSQVKPSVLDVTAGLGRDAFILATLGCQVTMLERHPLVALLLDDGLQRARQDASMAPVTKRMQLVTMDARDYLSQLVLYKQPMPDVIVMDPMFPDTGKSAKVKKEMQVLQQLLGVDQGGEELLQQALTVAQKRVAVKRPRLAAPLANLQPAHQVKGNSGRFDLYYTGYSSA